MSSASAVTDSSMAGCKEPGQFCLTLLFLIDSQMGTLFTDADWDGLERALRTCAPVTAEECAYLKRSFLATERMWAENVAQVATARLVMLSEAPLFGIAERYFYNTATKFGAFFYFQDAEAILGQSFAKGRTGKQFLLSELARAGFIVLDVFPFALNEQDTPSANYRKMSAQCYRELFQRTASLYFDRKRDFVLQFGKPHFLFRYGKLKSRLGDLVDAALAKAGLGPTQSVGGSNMALDREKLRQICEGHPVGHRTSIEFGNRSFVPSGQRFS